MTARRSQNPTSVSAAEGRGSSREGVEGAARGPLDPQPPEHPDERREDAGMGPAPGPVRSIGDRCDYCGADEWELCSEDCAVLEQYDGD